MLRRNLPRTIKVSTERGKDGVLTSQESCLLRCFRGTQELLLKYVMCGREMRAAVMLQLKGEEGLQVL